MSGIFFCFIFLNIVAYYSAYVILFCFLAGRCFMVIVGIIFFVVFVSTVRGHIIARLLERDKKTRWDYYVEISVESILFAMALKLILDGLYWKG